MDVTNIILTICVNALPLILAITLHEAAHGYVARHFGASVVPIWSVGEVPGLPLTSNLRM